MLLFYYPQFKKDLTVLKKTGIIGADFDWKKRKTSLAEYFSWITGGIPRTPVPGGFWGPIEANITVKGRQLKRGSLTRLLNKQRNLIKLESDDFKEIKRIVLAYRAAKEKKKQDTIKAKKTLCEIKKIVREYYNQENKNLKMASLAITEIESIIRKWRSTEKLARNGKIGKIGKNKL